ncbi:MAG: hypothetical protein AAGD05_12360, partial [Bacteroidota bacterium]
MLLLGDLSIPTSSPQPYVPEQQATIQNLVELSQANPQLKTYGLLGDQDWDNSGPQALEQLSTLQRYLSDQSIPIYPTGACPGPKEIELNEYTTLLVINSQWFIHPHERPEAPATDCKIISEADFWDELKDKIEDAKGKNILIAAHHPVYSGGQFAGKKWGAYHAIPIFGTLYRSFRRQVGTPRDIAFPAYREFQHHMQKLLSNYQSIIYVAGHEHNLQAIEANQNFHLNSGGLTKAKPVQNQKKHWFAQARPGFMKLLYYPDGRVDLQVFSERGGEVALQYSQQLLQSACEAPSTTSATPFTNQAYRPCVDPTATTSATRPTTFAPTGETVAGPEYKASKWKQFWMGPNYRREWTMPIEVPYLDLEKQYGGMTPFATGGGLQTNSLKFVAGNGREYAFRSVNKVPEKALSELERQTVYRHIVKDLITTQHPYGSLVAAKLMDTTDILHVTPQLFLMPDHPSLGKYRQSFANTLGLLELRPGKAKGSIKLLGGADKISSSPKMFRSFYKDNDNRIDHQAYAKARVFDLWVGDWDRHDDNWKWAVYNQGKGKRYRPIPRDRDHVFSQWEGIIPSLADRFIPNAEHFGKKFGNIQQLTFKAQFIDRQLGSALVLDDWTAAAQYISERMTDQQIDSAITALPLAVRTVSGKEIGDKLKSRRSHLEKAAADFYRLLAREVDVVGSNKREVFEIDRKANGDVEVRMYDYDKDLETAGELIYQRVFKRGETREIRLFGLGEEDEFYLNG